MENRINIAELLKDCPKGMELDCTMYEGVTLLKVDEDMENRIFPISVLRADGSLILLTKYGQYADADFAKCVIFPKGKTTWEGFVSPCKFKDGDILATDLGSVFCLNTHLNTDEYYGCYVGAGSDGSFHICEPFAYKECCGFATKEEKQKLFQAIREHGYKWNPETKTLEKISKLTFKNGDIVATNSGSWIGITTGGKEGELIPTYCVIKGDNRFEAYLDVKKEWVFSRLATEEEKAKLFQTIKNNGYKWNSEAKALEKLIKPEFKVGDVIVEKHKHLHCDRCYDKIVRITDDKYIFNDGSHIFIREQDNWRLVKFNIDTLIPFESKVLVRHNKDNKWTGSFFSFVDRDLQSHCYKFVTTADKSYPMMIPYKGNEYLLGKTEDCNDFYKIW